MHSGFFDFEPGPTLTGEAVVGFEVEAARSASNRFEVEARMSGTIIPDMHVVLIDLLLPCCSDSTHMSC